MGTGVPPGLQNQSPRRSRRRGVGSIPTRFRHPSPQHTAAVSCLALSHHESEIRGVFQRLARPKHEERAPREVRGKVVQAVYIMLVVGTTASVGLLRSFHDQTPRLFPGAFGSLLGIAFLAFLAMHLVERSERRDLFPPPEGRGGLTPALAIPLLVLLLGEKWFSVDLLDRAYDWIDIAVKDPLLADATYRLWTGLTLLGTALGLSWVLRQSWHRIVRLVTRRRLAQATWLTAVSMIGMALLLTSIALVAHSRNWIVLHAPAPTLLTAAIAQMTRAASEELFYRGLLQTALIRLLAEAGLGEGRIARLSAILAVSTGFSLEHYDPAATLENNLHALLFVFVISAALGALLEVAHNLYVVVASHAVINLCLAGLLPLPATENGEALLRPAIAGTVFMILVFTLVALRHARRSRG